MERLLGRFAIMARVKDALVDDRVLEAGKRVAARPWVIRRGRPWLRTVLCVVPIAVGVSFDWTHD